MQPFFGWRAATGAWCNNIIRSPRRHIPFFFMTVSMQPSFDGEWGQECDSITLFDGGDDTSIFCNGGVSTTIFFDGEQQDWLSFNATILFNQRKTTMTQQKCYNKRRYNGWNTFYHHSIRKVWSILFWLRKKGALIWLKNSLLCPTNSIMIKKELLKLT